MIVKDKSEAKTRTCRKSAAISSDDKLKIVQKILDDQRIIREAIQNGVSLKELEKTHGFKFATLPPVKD